MIIVHEPAEVARAATGPITFVPTMGALHAGHASLVSLAAADSGTVVVSVFVNPSQFGPGEDFGRYPRDLAADARLAEQAGADILFAPAVETVYPVGFATTVDPGPIAMDLCGRTRPGHFAGVATVVTRLYGLVQPQRAIFGRKDYQQLVVLRQTAVDLALGVDVVGAPTVRDADGLALSSRNAFLSSDERSRALALPACLAAIAAAHHAGERDGTHLEAVGREHLAGLAVEYLELRAADRLGPWTPDRLGVALVAARVGTTRLIDNILLDPAQPGSALASAFPKEPS